VAGGVDEHQVGLEMVAQGQFVGDVACHGYGVALAHEDGPLGFDHVRIAT
jgi:hypothetical protein